MYRVDYIEYNNTKNSLVCKTKDSAIFYAILVQFVLQRSDDVEYALKLPFLEILSRSGKIEVPIFPDIEEISLSGGGHTRHLLKESLLPLKSDILIDGRKYSIMVNYESTGYHITKYDIEAEDVSWLWF